MATGIIDHRIEPHAARHATLLVGRSLAAEPSAAIGRGGALIHIAYGTWVTLAAITAWNILSTLAAVTLIGCRYDRAPTDGAFTDIYIDPAHPARDAATGVAAPLLPAESTCLGIRTEDQKEQNHQGTQHGPESTHGHLPSMQGFGWVESVTEFTTLLCSVNPSLPFYPFSAFYLDGATVNEDSLPAEIRSVYCLTSDRA